MFRPGGLVVHKFYPFAGETDDSEEVFMGSPQEFPPKMQFGLKSAPMAREFVLRKYENIDCFATLIIIAPGFTCEILAT